jgi:hypothetical protein
MKMILIAISMAYTVGYGPVLAQSAEETAAFIISGVEDGAKVVKDGTVVANLTLIAQSPATFSLSSPTNQPMGEISVQEIEKCKFEVKARKTSQETQSATYDFNKLSGVTFELGYGLLNFAGSCAAKGPGGSCTSKVLAGDLIPIPPQRIVKAVDFMKATYCSGSAF